MDKRKFAVGSAMTGILKDINLHLYVAVGCFAGSLAVTMLEVKIK